MGAVVVTGASSGIGRAAAVALAATGREVVLVGRHPGRLADAVAAVRAVSGRTPDSHRADFAVLDEVRRLGATLNARHDRIDVLANNAGLLAARPRRTVDGHELTMQVNHLAGFLLAHLLLDRLAGEPPGRVITTASFAEVWGPLRPARVGATPRRWYSRWLAYGASKQANVLFTVEAARRWASRGVVATCFFPGLVRSRFALSSPSFWLGRLLPMAMVGPETAADTMTWLATDPAGESGTGGYFASRAPMWASPRATDPARAAALWEASRTAVGLAPDGPQ